MLKPILAWLVVAVVMAGTRAVAGPLEDATAADEGGHYATALKILTTLADQGNALAQARLGLLYHQGRPPEDMPGRLSADRPASVPQDPTEAMKWYRRSAAQGYAPTYVLVGMAYLYGSDGLPEDPVLAYMWLNLASAQGNQDAAQLRDVCALGMTPNQIAEAQRLAQEWKPKAEH